MAETYAYKYLMYSITVRSSGVTVDNILFYATITVDYTQNQYGEKVDKRIGYALISASARSTALGGQTENASNGVSNTSYETSPDGSSITLGFSYNIYSINPNYETMSWSDSGTGHITRTVYANELKF